MNKEVRTKSTVRQAEPGTLKEYLEHFSLTQLEDLLTGAERLGNEERAALIREAMLRGQQVDLARAWDALETYLAGIDRPHFWSTWRDEGIVALRLRVQLGEAGLPVATPGLTFWVREDDEGFQLLTDWVDAPLPSDFARRTARIFPSGSFGAKRIEHLIAAQASFA